MKKIVIAALVAALAFTGGVIAAPSAQAGTSDYVSFVRYELPSARSVPTSTLVKLGRAICKGLNVLTVQTVVDTARDSDLSDNEASTIIVGAVYFICPKHMAKLERWIDS